jgi:hypothetical protein
MVLAGSVTDYDNSVPGCAPQVYRKGATFVDSGGTDVHMLQNNGTETAETLAIQLLPKDQPRRIDKPKPAGC